MVFVIAVVVGGLFGAGDQYLGSIASAGAWTAAVSLRSAPWLVLPFAFGCSQVSRGRAAAAGLVASVAGLIGYFVMIMGPFEGGHSSFTATEIRGLLASNLLNIGGALVTGPLYGWLGQRWRTMRAPSSAALVAGALLLEPVVLYLLRRPQAQAPLAVPVAEMCCGVVLAAFFAITKQRSRRRHPEELAAGG